MVMAARPSLSGLISVLVQSDRRRALFSLADASEESAKMFVSKVSGMKSYEKSLS